MDVTVQGLYQSNSNGFAFHMNSRKYWEIDYEDGKNGHEYHMGLLCSQCWQGRDPDLIARRRG